MKSLRKLLLCLLVPPVLMLAAYGGYQASKRMWNRLDFTREQTRSESFAERKRELASYSWRDSRPLHLFAGDSHIESCNWYQAFRGALSVRNTGISTARIEEVTDFLGAVREDRIHTLLLHCGINNLGRGDSPASCLVHYRKLLEQAEKMRPGRILVVSVMPVRQSPVDSKARECNTRVREFNLLLEDLCKSRGIALLDLKGIVAGTNGGLKEEFTNDGLHLNPRGYAAITPRILDSLTADR
jgi:lysophospholipase L1-like esterase